MERMNGIELVARIDFLLKKIGKSRQELANEIGFTVTNIAHWKSRNSLPDADTLYALSKYFGVSVSYLLTGESDMELSEDVYLAAKKLQLLPIELRKAVIELIEHQIDIFIKTQNRQ